MEVWVSNNKNNIQILNHFAFFSPKVREKFYWDIHVVGHHDPPCPSGCGQGNRKLVDKLSTSPY